MGIKLKPILQKIMSILKKEKFYIKRMKGSHIILNREPKLRRPIIIPNKNKLSNAVRQNLINQCKEIDINTEKLEELF